MRLRRETGIAFALGGLLAVKMVAFEPLRPALFGMEFELVAILLPLALPLGWRGVAALGIGCGLAHAVHGTGPWEGLATGVAVAASLAAVHLGVRRPWDLGGILARCLTLAGLLGLALGLALAAARSLPLPTAVGLTFANTIVPVALGGTTALFLASRIVRMTRGPGTREAAA